MASDEDRLRQLNCEYISAFLKGDVAWYQEYLAADFVCIESDGSVLGKAEFLHRTARGPDVATYKLDQVQVRIYEGVALVQATGLFTRKDGSAGKSRYTDIYARTNSEWRVVSAQITRTANSDK